MFTDDFMATISIFILGVVAFLLFAAMLWYFFKTIGVIWRYNSLLAVTAVLFSPIVQVVFYFMPKDEFDKHEVELFKKYFLSIGLVSLLGVFAAVVIPDISSQKNFSVYEIENLDFDEVESLANQGNSSAQAHLGSMYDIGEDVPKDYNKAAYWYEKAAEQEEAIAQIGLAMKYSSGEGVRQDSTKAAELFEKAAEQGFSDAQHNIGVMYSEGVGVRQNYNTAFKWHEKAANQGLDESMLSLAWMYYKGEGVRQDNAQAKEWYGKACDNGNQMGCDNYRSKN
ncbi:tetratricopeptide repeat protein [Psychrobacter fozii]|uniref:Sel1 repeat-containing protein n=1 Tax=Psychrobacter fozii TaxID=198480 RepID=A0A2V4ULC7_9GAMM|nr:tetratricopeptide repeat protein [Psychrobacter fozii]PYE40977.1 Sel1 repeat-containing protein [Psychrobacter fozii]